MDEYYSNEMKRCADAIEQDGLDATVEISATDLMILLSKAAMQRLPIIVKEKAGPNYIYTTDSGSGNPYSYSPYEQPVDSNGVAYAPRAPILPKEKPQGSTGATRRARG